MVCIFNETHTVSFSSETLKLSELPLSKYWLSLPRVAIGAIFELLQKASKPRSNVEAIAVCKLIHLHPLREERTSILLDPPHHWLTAHWQMTVWMLFWSQALLSMRSVFQLEIHKKNQANNLTLHAISNQRNPFICTNWQHEGIRHPHCKHKIL